MGLQEDFKALRQGWSSLSLPGKIIAGAGFFVSASSIASISDTAFEFKGFIVDAIEFYRYLTAPLIVWAHELFGIELTRLSADVVVLLNLYCATFLRAIYILEPVVTPTTNEGQSSIWWLIGGVAFLVSLVVGVLAIMIWATVYIPRIVLVILAYMCFSTLWMGLSTLNPSSDDAKDAGLLETGKMARLQFTYIVAIVLAVAVVAAISEGLSRSFE